MSTFSIKEFRPTIYFLARFLAIYLVGNLLYGIYVTRYEPSVDPITHWVSAQVAAVNSSIGWPTSVVDARDHPTTNLVHNGKAIISVYEGCNGLNTMIIFCAFIFAFGPITRVLWWFIPVGLLVIHVANLFRVGLLFFVAQYHPSMMYFVHKYLFTAILYLIIFVLWLLWLKYFARPMKS